MITQKRLALIERVQRFLGDNPDGETYEALAADVKRAAIKDVLKASKQIADTAIPNDSQERATFREWMRIQGQAQQGKPFSLAPNLESIRTGD